MLSKRQRDPEKQPLLYKPMHRRLSDGSGTTQHWLHDTMLSQSASTLVAMLVRGSWMGLMTVMMNIMLSIIIISTNQEVLTGIVMKVLANTWMSIASRSQCSLILLMPEGFECTSPAEQWLLCRAAVVLPSIAVKGVLCGIVS